MDKVELKRRTQKFAVDVIKSMESLPSNRPANVLSNQLLRSATSIGANYRSACKGKSTADFINKIIISEEEAGESIYWLELIEECGFGSITTAASLKKEATELTAIFTAIGKTAKENQKIKNLKNKINSKSNIRNSKFEIKMTDALKRYNQKISSASVEDMVLNMGPQHPSTHGVLRLELITDGEIVKEVIPHIGYLHRCFEKHAESLTYQQTIPFTDRMDYLASMNNSHAFVMGVERMMGIDKDIPKRIEYIRVLVCELNRIGSHLIAIGTYGIDIGAFTPFLWCFRDREHIMGLLEWASGSRMLYNYIWVGGLFYDLPVGFEERCQEFVDYFKPKMVELNQLLTDNQVFINRTANIGVLPLDVAINYGCSGPMLRGSGLKWDLRRIDNYSVYPEIEFDVPVGKGEMGTLGDCWDRYKVRVDEIEQSLKIIEQCIERLQKELKRTPDFDPRAKLPRKTIPKAQDYYVRCEGAKGELGFYFMCDGKSEIPTRVKARAPSFSNLSVLPEISKGVLIADLVAIVGSIDFVLGEVDR